MIKKSKFIIGLIIVFITFTAFKNTIKNNVEPPFNSVTIGSQVWMTENLNINTFRNGEKIPEAKTAADWALASKNKQPAWCYYDFNPANGSKYGKLYNFFAVNDPRGLAPDGWHVSTNEDWQTLTEHCGGWYNAGKKIKSKTGWERGEAGTNETGFNALPSGVMLGSNTAADCKFMSLGILGYFWSSTATGNGINAWSWNVNMGDGNLKKRFDEYNNGLAVRCVKD
ncbi:MAG: fibrobacter succinogenes major paralogous domain-containing protein [Flavobacteriales bacterium]|nr:fibrobacter succinogenes major paralogous domain-containing protein [Flavobacteriales bacterium]